MKIALKTKFITITIIIALFILISSCGTHSLKTMPEGNDWIRCPECNGFGEIEKMRYTSVSRDEIKKWKCPASCLNFFINDKVEDYERKQSPTGTVPPENFRALSDNNLYDSQNRRPEIQYVRCKKCKGRGWIKDSEPGK
jgi:hypothetical protein